MSAPAQDHLIEIELWDTRVRVLFGGEVIADTGRALVMRETVYPLIYYIPREDVRIEVLTPSEHTTRCPHKGMASHFNLSCGGQQVDNAVWSYEDPLESVSEIEGHCAFYPRYVEFRTGDDT